MERFARVAAAALAVALAVALPGVPAFASMPLAAADDDVPGVALSPSPVAGSLHSVTDHADVHSVWLTEGDVLAVQLAIGAATPGFAPTLHLYPPGTPSLVSSPDWVAASQEVSFPKTIRYVASRSGVHYLEVYQSPFAPAPESGSTQVSWSVHSPVYRFYNAGSGTHFFTPSPEERRMVVATLSSIYRYEGVAYYTQPYLNAQPLYRFYNRVSRSHFYTASGSERDTVIARWPHIFTYEGETYRVSLAGPPGAAVYRFFNVGNGSHFFTASATERDAVRAELSSIYVYEGPVFYLEP